MSRISLDKPTAYLCPRIVSAENNRVYFGGDQTWFTRNTAFAGGCGPVAAANVLTVYADQHPECQEDLSIAINEKHFIPQEDYLSLLDQIYRIMHPMEVPVIRRIYDHVSRANKVFNKIPVTFGVNILQYILGVKRFAKRHYIYLHHRSLSTMFCGYMRGLTFIKLALANGYPITLLVTGSPVPYILYDLPYFQGGHEKALKHHFVTITDIRESANNNASPELVITTWGKTGTISYTDLHRSWRSPRAFGSAMVYFR